MTSALDRFGHVKQIGLDEIKASELLIGDLLRQIEDGLSEPFGTAIALWIALTARLVSAGVPSQTIVDTAIRAACQASSAGSA